MAFQRIQYVNKVLSSFAKKNLVGSSWQSTWHIKIYLSQNVALVLLLGKYRPQPTGRQVSGRPGWFWQRLRQVGSGKKCPNQNQTKPTFLNVLQCGKCLKIQKKIEKKIAVNPQKTLFLWIHSTFCTFFIILKHIAQIFGTQYLILAKNGT